MLVHVARKNYLIIFLFLISFTTLIGQQKYNFEHISIPDGLSNAQVWDIVQDKYGFLWIATADGLNQYDGYSFKIYKNDPGDPKSLSNNFVYSLMIDKDENLWVGTTGGLSKYDRANETFENYLPDSSRANATVNTIISIAQDRKNRIWLSTADGIVKYDRTIGKFERTFIKNGNNKVPYTGTTGVSIETSSGEIYSHYFFEGLTKYNELSNLFERVNINTTNPDAFKEQILFGLYEDKTGKIWIGSENGFYNYDPRNGLFNEKILFKKAINPTRWENGVFEILPDNDGFLWIGSAANGIFRINMKTNEVTQLGQTELPKSVNTTDGFMRFFKDNFGILWVGSNNNGLLKLDFQKEPFRVYTNLTDKVNSNINLFIASIYKNRSENDFIWLGTNDGLVKYNLKQKTFNKLKHQEGNAKSIPSNFISSFQQGSSQDLWLGTDKGLSLMNLTTNSFTNYYLIDKTKHYSLDYSNIRSLSMDDYGNLWIASGLNGLVKFDTKSKTQQFIPTFAARTYDLKLISFIDSLNSKNNSIVKLTEVGDFQDLKKEFTIEKQNEVIIVCCGRRS